MSSNSTHKWTLHAQVMSALASGYCRSHNTYQFLVYLLYKKNFRGDGGNSEHSFPTLCAPGAQTVVNASELQHISSMNTMIHPSQDCSGENSAFEEESSLFSGEKFQEKTAGQREACLLLWHAKGKDPALQHPAEIQNSSPGVWQCCWTLSRDHTLLCKEQLLCPFPSWSKHFRLGIILTWNRGFPEGWKKDSSKLNNNK